LGTVKIISHPAGFPGRTVWGRTQGPVAFMGEVAFGDSRLAGVGCYLDLRESRQLLVAWRDAGRLDELLDGLVAEEADEQLESPFEEPDLAEAS
jgi:hypothetical protein